VVAGSPRRSAGDSSAKPPCRFSTASTAYLASRTGDMKKLKAPRTGFRLRCGDYRVFIDHKDKASLEITGVRNRREAYR
jgi:mRNA-degrading endonuclease RelE of RelBE toxin-antitoxin system